MQRDLLTPSPTTSESDDDSKLNKLDLLIRAANYLENFDSKRQRGNELIQFRAFSEPVRQTDSHFIDDLSCLTIPPVLYDHIK